MAIPQKNITSTPINNSKANLTTNDKDVSTVKWLGRKIKVFLAKVVMSLHCLIVYRSLPNNLDIAKVDQMWGVNKKIFNVAYRERMARRIEEDNLKKVSDAFFDGVKLEYDNKGRSIENIKIVEIDEVNRPSYSRAERTTGRQLMEHICDDSVSDALFERFLYLTNELIEHGKLDKQGLVGAFRQGINGPSGSDTIVTVCMEDVQGCRANKLKSLFNFIKDLDVPVTDKIDIIIGDKYLTYFFTYVKRKCYAEDMASQVDYFVSLVNEILYPTIKSESDKKYFSKKLGKNLIKATSDGAMAFTGKLVDRLLNLVLSKSICDETTKQKCIDNMVKKSSFFFKSDFEGEEYARGFSKAVSSTEHLTKEKKLDILSRTLICLEKEENSLNESISKLKAEKATQLTLNNIRDSQATREAIQRARANIERAIDDIKNDET